MKWNLPHNLSVAENLLKQGEFEKSRNIVIEHLNNTGMEPVALCLLGDTFAAESLYREGGSKTVAETLSSLEGSNKNYDIAMQTYDMAKTLADKNSAAPALKEMCLEKEEMFLSATKVFMDQCIEDSIIDRDVLNAAGLSNTEGMSKREIFDQICSIRVDGGLYHDHYIEWRKKRIKKIIEIYGETFLKGKRIVEMAAGHGDIGAQFAKLGCDVLCLEGREGNVRVAREKYKSLPNIEFKQCNLEGDFTQHGPCDLLINFGLLYHLKNFDEHLKNCMKMSDNIVVETVVLDSTDPNKIIFFEEDQFLMFLNDSAVDGTGAYASPYYIERLFEEGGFETHRHFSDDINTSQHFYDWQHKDDDGQDQSNRRFWHFKRRGS